MSYQVPQHIDPNKVFLINLSEIERRLDPEPYHNERKDAINKIKQTDHYLPLSSIVSFAKVITKNIKQGDIYLGLENITSEYGEYVETTEKESISSAAVFEKGDILFPKLRPYLNKVFYATFDGICSTEFYVLKSTSVNAEYLSIFLRSSLVVNQTKHLMTGNTLPRLQTEDVKDLLIPIPSKIIQQRIIDYYNAAYAQKQQKEQQADALLQSIDDYLLSELGIQLPEAKSQTIQDRMFVVNFSEVSGGRFDSKLYSNAIKQLKQSLFTSPYEKQPLNYFIKSSCSGEWGKDETEEVDESKNTKCLVIRATEFDNTYNLRLDNSRVKYRWIDNSKLSRMDILPNDLLIEKSGGSEDQPVGRVSILTEDILQSHQIAYSNFIHKITVDGINPKYLYFYLKTMHNIGITESMQSQTNGIRNLIMKEYYDQIIVIPPLQKQQEIVDYISSIRQQAKALQEEGKAILEQAKKEVEQMILGNRIVTN